MSIAGQFDGRVVPWRRAKEAFNERFNLLQRLTRIAFEALRLFSKGTGERQKLADAPVDHGEFLLEEAKGFQALQIP